MSNNITILDCYKVTTIQGDILFKGYGNNSVSESFECQTNGIVSDSIVQSWTPQAIDCYKIHSDCASCPITRAGYSFKCQMKHIVDILLETLGLPEEPKVNDDDDIVA